MLLHINPSSGMPIYRQLVQQLRGRILSGQIKPGDKLPSVREASMDLSINFLTVSKAYQLLELEELVETRRGLGTFAKENRRIVSMREKTRLIQPVLDQMVAEARHLGLEDEILLNLVKRAMRQQKS